MTEQLNNTTQSKMKHKTKQNETKQKTKQLNPRVRRPPPPPQPVVSLLRPTIKSTIHRRWDRG